MPKYQRHSWSTSAPPKPGKADEKPLPPPPKSHYQLYWWLVASCLSILLPLLVGFVGMQQRQFVYASYQPTICTILDKRVRSEYISYKNGGYYRYSPDVTFAVSLPNGGTQTIIGYANIGVSGQDVTYFSTADAAQNVLDQYHLQSAYPCWYSTYDGRVHAALVLRNYPPLGVVGSWVLTLALGIPLLLLTARFVLSQYKIRVLARRGVRTTGFVSEYHTVNVWVDALKISEVKSVITLVEFWTRTTPTFEYQIRLRGQIYGAKRKRKRHAIAPGKYVDVIYDPRDPDNTSIGELPESAYNDQHLRDSSLLALIVALLALVALYVSWRFFYF